MSVMTLKPGYLVSLRTSVRGGVQYQREDLDKGSEREGAKVEKWQTTKVTTDPEEHDKATKTRSKCGSIVRSVCVPSDFGYICPLSKEKELNEAIAEARALAAAFNETAMNSSVYVYVIKGQIAATDQEATAAIRGELRDMLDGMQTAIGEGNIEKARTIASDAKKFGAMLDEGAAKKVSDAIAEVRDIAKDVIKKVASGVAMADAVKDVKLKALENARTSFLDLEESVAVEAIGAAPRPVDLDEEEDPATAKAAGAPDRDAEAKAASGGEVRALDV